MKFLFPQAMVTVALMLAGFANVLSAQAQCTPPPSGLVAWWSGEGNGNDNVGTNTALVPPGVAFVAGKVGQAFNFNANVVNTNVTIADAPALNPTNQLTIECWVYPRTRPDPLATWGQDLISKDGECSERQYVLNVNDSQVSPGSPDFRAHVWTSNGQFILDGNTVIQTNTWYHVAMTYDGTSLKLYINGALDSLMGASGSIVVTPQPVRLGGGAPGNCFKFDFNGILDEPAIYNRALSASEIQSIFNAGSAGKCSAGTIPAGGPIITSFTPTTATAGATVTITGQNFSSSAANDIVYFGGVQAAVTTASATSLTVTVPNGATYSPLTVTVSGQTAYSTHLFLPTYHGTGTIDSSTLGAGINFAATGSGPSVTALADIDGDGRPDVVVNNGSGVRGIYIYRNLSTNGPITASSFAPAVIVPLGTGGENGMTVADINGDGKLDLLCVDNNSNVVVVIQNFSTPGNINSDTFGPRVNRPVGNGPRDVAVEDLDGDGQPDIVSANWNDNSISIIRNIGAGATITADSFAPAQTYATPSGPHEVRIADVDGDGVPDIISANNGTTDAAISVFQNLSAPGTNVLAPRIDFPGLLGSQFLAIGDVDGDGKSDVAVGSFANGQAVSIYRNTSIAGIIDTNSFAPRIDFPVGGWANGVALGDLDGDGRPDIIVSTKLPSHLSVFKNISSPGSFTAGSLATRIDFPSGSSPYTAAVGDLNNDGAPDVVLANNDDNIETVYPNLNVIGVPPTILSQPLSKNVFAGTTVSFIVSANGSSPLTYQWKFNGTNLSGATGPTLTLSNVQPSQAGNYFATVANPFGSTNTAVATLVVSNGTAPFITFQPTNRTVTIGQSTTFAVGATGTAPLSFQWRLNGTNLIGKTNSSFTLSNIQTSQAGAYSAVVTNPFGTAISSNAVLTVSGGVPPFITLQPTNRTVTVGQSTTFAVGATGTAPLSFQWRFNGTNLIGKTNSVLTLSNIQVSQAGGYSALVANNFGSTNSATAVLTVSGGTCVAPPSGLVSWWPAEGNANDIVGTNNGALQGPVGFGPGKVGNAFLFTNNNAAVRMPASSSLDVGAGNGFTIEGWINPNNVAALGTIAEWNNDGTDLGIHFYINPATPGGNVPGTLYANIFPAGGTNHQIWSAAVVTNNGLQHVALTYDKASGVATIYYNGTAVAQQTIGSFSASTAFPFYIGRRPLTFGETFNFMGSIDELSLYSRALSASEIQSVVNAGANGKCANLSPPLVVSQPTNRTATVGQTTTFTVTAAGTGPLAYQWLFNGTIISGATGTSLTLTNVQLDHAGNYSVIVTNVLGSATSSNAVLTVVSPTCVTAPSGLIGWWQAEGNGSDATGAHDATLMNGVSFVPGKVGQAFRFTGGNDGQSNPCVMIPYAPGMISSTFSVEAWINPQSQVTNADAQSWIFGQTYGLQMNVRPGTTGVRVDFQISTSQSSFYTVVSTVDIPLNQYTHVAGTWDGAVLRLYLNGVLNNSITPGVQPVDEGCDFFIGGIYHPANDSCQSVSQFFNGYIDELGYYGRALSASEIQSIYNAAGAGKCPILLPPAIATQPTSRTVTVGQTTTFNVSVTGTGPLAYQWRFNGTNLAGATGSSLTLTNVQPSQAGNYSVTVTNVLGSVTSSNATLTVHAIAPFITVQPTNRTVIVGQTTTFFVAAGGTAPLSYQWRLNGTNLPGATSAVLTLTNVQASQAGNYSAQVSNVAGATNSLNAVLTVLVPPSIDGQPADQTVIQGQTATFAVSVTGTAPLNYQWTFNGTNILGATNASLVLANAQAAQAGTYAVNISNVAGATNSANATLTVLVPPSITTQPTDRIVTVGETATFTVGATGTAPLAYQWKFNGTDLAGATNASLVLANVQTNQAGVYSVGIVNLAGSTNSVGATLKVNSPPVADATATTPLVISVNGSNAIVILDGSRSSDVDGDPLQYTWYEDGQTNALTNGVIAVVTLPVGTNSITLIVSDGLATNSQTISVAVITLDQAVQQLMDTVNIDFPNRQSLIATLRAALASINRDDPTSAVNQLQTFQNKVQIQLMPIDPTTAQTLIDDAQSIINAIEGTSGGISSQILLDATKRNGKLHLNFDAARGRYYIIEASSDLTHWDKIGIAQDDGTGTFNFDDNGKAAARYYRVMSP